jgi:hypothetical protein
MKMAFEYFFRAARCNSKCCSPGAPITYLAIDTTAGCFFMKAPEIKRFWGFCRSALEYEYQITKNIVAVYQLHR